MVEQNKFVAYSLCTRNHNTVQDAYMQIRLNHAEARHIVCAWNIPDKNDYESIGWCDDEEYGAGKAVAEILEKNNVIHRVVFIVRNCGIKLKNRRIPSYVTMVTNLVQQYPDNPIAKKQQYISTDQDKENTADDAPPKTYAKAAISRPLRKDYPIQRGRGRGRTRRGQGGRGGMYGRGLKTHTNNQDMKPVETYIPRKIP